MEKEVKVGIHNRFDLIKRDAKTGEIIGEYYAENTILNSFWSLFLSTSEYKVPFKIQFGSGTAAPLVTDTTLTSQLGVKDATTSSIDTTKFFSDGVVAVKRTCRLDDTEYVGSTIAEVGIGNSKSQLLTKALIKDSNGNQISIVKGAGEVLDIFSTFYTHYGDYRQGVGKDGIEVPYLSWLSEIQYYNTVNARYTMLPVSPSGYNADGIIYDTAGFAPTFDAATKKMFYNIPNVNSASGNLSAGYKKLIVHGIYISIPNMGLTQPPLIKEVIGIGDGITTDFTAKFGYIKDNGTSKVYVNDVEVPATISYDKPPSLDVMALKGVAGQSIATFENVYADEFNITSVIIKQDGSIAVSNDLVTWNNAVYHAGYGQTINIPAQYQNYRYWRSLNWAGTGAAATSVWKSSQLLALKPIKLTTPPAVGDTVALTYQPDAIAKDANHVLNNVKVTVSFAEYTPT